MKIKTSELAGVALDWAVAKCEGVAAMRCGAGASAYLAYVPKRTAYKKYAPSTNWSQGGPIIEREKIGVWWATHFIDDDDVEYGNHWYAEADGHCATGDTPLIAAMRCYVASKMGDEIDVPDALCL